MWLSSKPTATLSSFALPAKVVSISSFIILTIEQTAEQKRAKWRIPILEISIEPGINPLLDNSSDSCSISYGLEDCSYFPISSLRILRESSWNALYTYRCVSLSSHFTRHTWYPVDTKEQNVAPLGLTSRDINPWLRGSELPICLFTRFQWELYCLLNSI